MQTKKMLRKEIPYGFSLLELVIVMALSSMLFVQVGYIYLNTKQIIIRQNSIARMQENKRFAANLLQAKISMAGYYGCGSVANLQLHNHVSADFNLAHSLRGYRAGNLPQYLHHKVKSGTDVIEIGKADLDVTSLEGEVAKASHILRVRRNPATEANQVLLLSDCTHAELFVAQNWRGNVIRANRGWAHDYGVVASEVARYELVAFFISATGRSYQGGELIYSLYMTVNRGNKQELLEGIDAMQISYGYRGRYYGAVAIDAAQLWDDVESVAINLRLQNIENTAAAAAKIKTKDDGWFKINIKLQQR